MRLIDADRLKPDVEAWTAEKKFEYRYSPEVINNAPTVVAIPIEWLEDIIEDWKDEATKTDEARKKMTAKNIPSDSIEALARIIALQGKRIDALVNELEKFDARLKAKKEEAEDEEGTDEA